VPYLTLALRVAKTYTIYMAIKNPDQRVGVFVDVSNMYYSAKNLYKGAKVDFGKVLQDAVAGRKLIRAIAYVIKADIKEEQSFFDALERAGYEVKSKDLQIFAGGAKKGDWDVGITVDAIKLADKLDTIILVSGDGDYEPLVNYLQENKGCYVEAFAFGRTASGKLIERTNEFHDLDEKPEDYLIQPRRRQEQPVKSATDTEPTGPLLQPESAAHEAIRHHTTPTFFSSVVAKKDQ
jgi:uncharacterized LabA/DUF88 family protein